MTFSSDARQTALDLTTEFGRQITLVQLASGPSDVTKPWRGQTDPRATPVATRVCLAVFVDPTSRSVLGMTAISDDAVKRATQIAIIATEEDLTKYTECIDFDDSLWRITSVTMLKPGTENILSFIGVAR